MKRSRLRRAQLQYTEAIPQVNDTTYDQLKNELMEIDNRIPNLGKKILPKDYQMTFNSPYLAISKPSQDKKLDTDTAKVIVTRTLQGALHEQYVNAWGSYFVITTCRVRSIYGRNVNTKLKEGIVVIRLSKLVIIARYEAPETSFTFIPKVELLADKLASMGY
uniref:Profilin n=1 Tax=Lotharella oceanica TaxID=641309 RepID=A0A7S2TRZ5_9EUKA|mmetsp:Transcript_2725/g.5176  ORF Transcript_2725/g.5176 Transcript_2725/m.5176 type:complete len:163 (+) Transcript_2725:133-621(+)|eukprot:CAMPEP_0170169896 /NCGR_PEP_ID=MMETSP0040_2-20121228/2832_1 /TAXON_ID=641309 /ORGANISM="Lotharella oceanica, Strain CCMP622" /LENGTH=162 /DNA_ID=CAMNT_0010408907 /DNA_START=102 /DNA_END=590 /DNA_ORIENTATION=-